MKDSIRNTLCQILQRLGLISDWVVEQGEAVTDNWCQWYYQKWNSGIITMHGKGTLSPRSGVRWDLANYPFTIYDDAVSVALSEENNWSYDPRYTKGEGTRVGWYSQPAGSGNIIVNILVQGRWKSFVGGVLRNPLISRLTAILKIGGGVNESHSQRNARQGIKCVTTETEQRLDSHWCQQWWGSVNLSRFNNSRLYRDIHYARKLWWYRSAYRSLADIYHVRGIPKRSIRSALWCPYNCYKHVTHMGISGLKQHYEFKRLPAICPLTISERGWAA